MRVEYFKHPNTPHWHHDPMVRLGEDEHGLWLGATKATWLQKGDLPVPKTAHERGFRATNRFVQLVVPDGWWTMIFNGRARDVTHYIDVVAPAVIAEDKVSFVDLDLDVIRAKDGRVSIDDEDEFLEHSVSLGYSDLWIDMARTTAASLVPRLERLDEPFGSVCRAWRKRLREIEKSTPNQ